MKSDSPGASVTSKIRLYVIRISRYKLPAMFTSFILAVAVAAADPSIVFGEEHVPPPVARGSDRTQTGSVMDLRSGGFPAADQGDSDRTQTGSVRDLRHRIRTAQDETTAAVVFRGQTVCEDPRVPICCHSRTACVWQDPHFQSLLSKLNPFAPFDYPVLENYFDPYGWQMLTGSCGPQPYRLGWSRFIELTLLPSSSAFGTTGSMQMTEWTSNAKFSKVVAPGVLFDATLWFGAQWWEGPGGISLPPQVDRLSTDLLFGFFDDGPWSAQIAFHPQIVKTYDAALDANAYNFDGRAILTYNYCPHWKAVVGFAIWDRVNTLVIPHVGLIWTPDELWEVRALFPTSKISYFLGNWAKADFWIYGQYEYTAESWQTVLSNPTISDRAQFIDQRLSAGLRWDKGRYNFHAEAGYVFDRQTKFTGSTPSFNLGDSAVVTFGVRY